MGFGPEGVLRSRLRLGAKSDRSQMPGWEAAANSHHRSARLADFTELARSHFTTGEVLCGALGFEAKAVQRRDEMRASKVLKGLGCRKERIVRSGQRFGLGSHQHTLVRWVGRGVGQDQDLVAQALANLPNLSN